DWADPCLYGAGGAASTSAPTIAPTIALWGDSHASALIPALDRLGRETGEAVALYARLGCPPLEDFRWFLQDRNHSCAGFNRASLASILETPEIATVVLTMRMALYTEGWVEVGFGERGRRPVIIGTDAAPLAEGADRTDFAMAGLEATVRTLRAAGKAVVLVYPIPEAPNDVPTTVVRQVMQGGAATGATIDRALFDRRNARVIEAYDRLVAEHGLLAVRPHDHLCDATACRLVDADGSVLYFDKNHLSVTGAERLGDLFVPVLAGDRRVDLDATDGGRIE
ncbi:MAG: SGNH hydrolase domain-containing protein, partial [Pseudomonadota bacterium]